MKREQGARQKWEAPQRRDQQQNWSEVNPGDWVTVVLPGGPEFQGTVDSKTRNSSVVWISPVDGGYRGAFDYREGVLLMPVVGIPLNASK